MQHMPHANKRKQVLTPENRPRTFRIYVWGGGGGCDWVCAWMRGGGPRNEVVEGVGMGARKLFPPHGAKPQNGLWHVFGHMQYVDDWMLQFGTFC